MAVNSMAASLSAERELRLIFFSCLIFETVRNLMFLVRTELK